MGGPEFSDKPYLVLRLELVLVLDVPALLELGIFKVPQHPNQAVLDVLVR